MKQQMNQKNKTENQGDQMSQPSNKQLKNMIKILVAAVIVLAIRAGYYQTALKVERTRFERYEDMFVRVRSQLGRDEMQRLIDQSYQENEEKLIDW